MNNVKKMKMEEIQNLFGGNRDVAKSSLRFQIESANLADRAGSW